MGQSLTVLDEAMLNWNIWGKVKKAFIALLVSFNISQTKLGYLKLNPEGIYRVDRTRFSM